MTERQGGNPLEPAVQNNGLHKQPVFNGQQVKKPVQFSPAEQIIILRDAKRALVKRAGK